MQSLGGEVVKKKQPLSVRFPIGIYEAIKNMAEKEKRSINQQVLLFIERGIETEKQEQTS